MWQEIVFPTTMSREGSPSSRHSEMNSDLAESRDNLRSKGKPNFVEYWYLRDIHDGESHPQLTVYQSWARGGRAPFAAPERICISGVE